MSNNANITERLTQIYMAEDICDVVHKQIDIISRLQQTQNQQECIVALCRATLDLARSFRSELIEIYRGE